eukprot:gene22141-25094_t
MKYRIEFPIRSSVESDCLHYIVDLVSVKCPGEIDIITGDVSIVRVVGCEQSNNGVMLAEGVLNASHWLSFRDFGHVDTNMLVQLFCGDSKEKKREVSRALKRAIGWATTWTDFDTSASQQLKDPTCGHVLLDKKLGHRNIKYVLDCDTNSKVQQTHLTIADIHLAMTISKWMAALEPEKEIIVATIPAVVHFVKTLRGELRALEYGYSGTGSIFAACFGHVAAWIDTAEVIADSQYSFKFTQKNKLTERETLGFPASKPEQAPLLNMTEIEERAQQLIDLAAWREPAIGAIGATNDSCDDMWDKMKLPSGREVRKKQQIVSLLNEISTVLPVGGIAVEFCSGGGYVGIPLAVLRPDCTVLLTDMNTVSIMYARQRVEALQLKNVKFLRQELAGIEASQQKAFADTGTAPAKKEETIISMEKKPAELQLMERFNVGIALHACGTATDAVLRICTRAGASFVVSPCCYGFLQHQANTNSTTGDGGDGENGKLCGECVQHTATSGTCVCETCNSPLQGLTPTTLSTSEGASFLSAYASYPASSAFRGSGWQGRWFAALCSQADRTFWSHDARASVHNEKGRLAMRAVDADRLLATQELGYTVYGTYMTPVEASVKNHILI